MQDPAAADRPTDHAAVQERGSEEERSEGPRTRAPDHRDAEAHSQTETP